VFLCFDHVASGIMNANHGIMAQKAFWRVLAGGKRFVARADEKLTAFLELEAPTRKEAERNTSRM